MILKFVQRWFNKRTRDIMQGANADDCIPSWRILFCLVQSWKVRIAADPHANSPSQTEGRRPCLAPNPHDALCRFCSPSRTHAPNPHYHSFTQSGLKWAMYDFFFFLAFEFPAHGDPLRRDAIAVFAHYTNRDYNWKIRNDGRKKKKKADAQMTEISVSADGDTGETKMTETPYQ